MECERPKEATIVNSDSRFGGPMGIILSLSLMAGACAKQVQTLNYLDPQAPSIYKAKQEAEDRAPLKSTGKEVKRDAKSYEAQGDQAMALGKMEEALAAYRQALSLNQDQGLIREKMGRILLYRNEPDQAIA